jgi:hypothetical protein
VFEEGAKVCEDACKTRKLFKVVREEASLSQLGSRSGLFVLSEGAGEGEAGSEINPSDSLTANGTQHVHLHAAINSQQA